jgi:hypothetical protein
LVLFEYISDAQSHERKIRLRSLCSLNADKKTDPSFLSLCSFSAEFLRERRQLKFVIRERRNHSACMSLNAHLKNHFSVTQYRFYESYKLCCETTFEHPKENYGSLSWVPWSTRNLDHIRPTGAKIKVDEQCFVYKTYRKFLWVSTGKHEDGQTQTSYSFHVTHHMMRTHKRVTDKIL